jgi:hypothetical protein
MEFLFGFESKEPFARYETKTADPGGDICSEQKPSLKSSGHDL